MERIIRFCNIVCAIFCRYYCYCCCCCACFFRRFALHLIHFFSGLFFGSILFVVCRLRRYILLILKSFVPYPKRSHSRIRARNWDAHWLWTHVELDLRILKIEMSFFLPTRSAIVCMCVFGLLRSCSVMCFYRSTLRILFYPPNQIVLFFWFLSFGFYCQCF